MEKLQFTAKTVSGSHRGRDLGTPTINLALEDVPRTLREGIHACQVTLDETPLDAVMHYGPRPVFNDTPSCEVHILDRTIAAMPPSVTVMVVGYLREVRNFPNVDAMMEQIARDIEDARAMLHGA